MALTQSQLKRKAERLERLLGSDTAEVVNEISEGWTIRKLTSFADAYREGVLMRNCFAPKSFENYTRDEWIYHPQTAWITYENEKEVIIDRNKNPEAPGKHGDIFFSKFNNIEEFDMNLLWKGKCFSLRDPDNIPHLSYCEERMELLGRNNSAVKPEYRERWEEYKVIDYSQHPTIKEMYASFEEGLDEEMFHHLKDISKELAAAKP